MGAQRQIIIEKVWQVCITREGIVYLQEGGQKGSDAKERSPVRVVFSFLLSEWHTSVCNNLNDSLVTRLSLFPNQQRMRRKITASAFVNIPNFFPIVLIIYSYNALLQVSQETTTM